jgi:zinc protease
MKRALTYILSLLLLAAAVQVAAQQSEGSKIIAQFQYPDLKWSVPEVGKEVQRTVLDNGLIVYLMEDHRLPMLSVTALVRCGEAYVSEQDMAIPEITGDVMRTGGTTHIPPDSLNALMESIGGSLESSIGYDNGRATLSVMSKDTDLGMELLADLLRNPAFPQDKIDLNKDQMKTDIKRRNDDPRSILSREFSHLLYGDHPEGRILEWAEVKPVTRQDLVDYHGRYFVPNNIMIGITGDFDSGEMLSLVKKYFGDWEKRDVELPAIPAVKAKPKPGVFLIRKDINQANIRFGHLGIDRDNPDRYAVSVMNYILGGGSFTSRMTSKVRSDKGLAYSVGSRYDIDQPDEGTFYAYCYTKSRTTHMAMRLMLDEVARIRQGEVSDEELASAKDSYINRFVFDFTSPEQIVSRLMSLEFDNRPPDLLKNYIDNIRKVTREDVLRVARKYLRPGDITFVVVGNPDTFEKPLDDFGPITTIELTDPKLD